MDSSAVQPSTTTVAPLSRRTSVIDGGLELSRSEKSVKTQENTELTNGTQNGAGDTKDGKLSGAELKKRAKEEKAARRAQGKQEKPGKQPSVTTGGLGTKQADLKVELTKKGALLPAPSTPTGKGQHKRTGSTNINIQKTMPIRQAQSQPAAITEQAKQDDKRVALFGHLYGQPRRTTIAVAARDVHPAVLALGLQMSNYVICGSNARCVASLLVFKRVSYIPYNISCSELTRTPGNRVIYHSTPKLPTSSPHRPPIRSD